MRDVDNNRLRIHCTRITIVMIHRLSYSDTWDRGGGNLQQFAPVPESCRNDFRQRATKVEMLEFRQLDYRNSQVSFRGKPNEQLLDYNCVDLL